MTSPDPFLEDEQIKLDRLLKTINEAGSDLMAMTAQKGARFASEISAIHEAGKIIQGHLPDLFRDIEKQGAEGRRTPLEEAFHDVRSPLNPIVGYCALILYESGEIEDRAFYNAVKTIEAAGYQIISILRKLEAELLPQQDDPYAS